MKNKLSYFFSNEKNIAIYDDVNDTMRFKYGRVCGVNENEFAITLISPKGEYDGIVVEKIERVLRIEVETKYNNNIDAICTISDFKLSQECLTSSNMFNDILMLSERSKKIIAVELFDSGYDDVIGFVDEIDGTCIKIKNIDVNGMEDGFSFINLNDITQVSYDSHNEQILLKIYKSSDGV